MRLFRRCIATSGMDRSDGSTHTQGMPIYRCNACGFIHELAPTLTPSHTPCGKCQTSCTVYETPYFVGEIIKRLASTTQELQRIKSTVSLIDTQPSTPPAATAPTALADWFAARQIEVQLNPALSDTSGFFDDAARQIGDGYALFGELLDRIRFAYRNSHHTVHLDLSQLAQKEVQTMTTLCRWLHEHTFFARYHYQKPERKARLTLQPATAMRQFFEGGWLEWYALMCLQDITQTQALCDYARGVKVVFPNEDEHELDVVALPQNGQPICIECKSGEFRRDIDKYLRLRKRLSLPRERFVILSPELTPEQARGFSTMYELSFSNLEMLRPHLQSLL